jgi:hypothetical protein
MENRQCITFRMSTTLLRQREVWRRIALSSRKLENLLMEIVRTLFCARFRKHAWDLPFRHDHNGSHYRTRICREGSGDMAVSLIHRNPQDKVREELRCLASSRVNP